jgi:hypothetical protein
MEIWPGSFGACLDWLVVCASNRAPACFGNGTNTPILPRTVNELLRETQNVKRNYDELSQLASAIAFTFLGFTFYFLA